MGGVIAGIASARKRKVGEAGGMEAARAKRRWWQAIAFDAGRAD